MPLVAFWTLLYFGREELSRKCISIFITIWVVSLILFNVFDIAPQFFVSLQAILDIILILLVFGHDLKIR